MSWLEDLLLSIVSFYTDFTFGENESTLYYDTYLDENCGISSLHAPSDSSAITIASSYRKTHAFEEVKILQL